MKPKIAFIASYPHSLLNFRLALMQAFISQGYAVLAIAPADTVVADILQKNHIRYIPIALQRNGLNPLHDLALLLKLKKILKQEEVEMVFSYTIKPVIYGSLAAKLARVPKIYAMITGTGYVFLNHNLKSRIVGWIARNLFRIALAVNKLIFFQNPDNLAYFKAQRIISANKSAAIINGSGVDCEFFTPTAYPATMTFLMIARFLHDKGIREYVAAARQIKLHYPEVKCRLVGWIDTNPNSITEQELNEWVENGYIEYLGKLDDVRAALADTAVYVLPSYHEGTPRTVLEAMAMARPIITTDAPGCRETVIPQQNGFLVPIKNVEQLCAAMTYFILHPEQISIMGQASRTLALEKYDVHKVNDSILQAMELCGAGSA